MDQTETQTQTETQAPDFTAEWEQIRNDLENEALGALRIGQTLIKIRDALKPLGRWLPALSEHGMSQPQASRYIRYAELPEADRERRQRFKGFSLSEAIGERRTKKAAENSGTDQAADYSSTNSHEISDEERADWFDEIERRLTRAVKIVNAGKEALAGEPEPQFADDDARWQHKVHETAEDVLAIIDAHLRKELQRRFPCR